MEELYSCLKVTLLGELEVDHALGSFALGDKTQCWPGCVVELDRVVTMTRVC